MTAPATRPRAAPGGTCSPGKVVVITAAAGTGIGSAAARRCLEEGARVVLSDQHERRLAAARAELAPAYGDRVCVAPLRRDRRERRSVRWWRARCGSSGGSTC